MIKITAYVRAFRLGERVSKPLLLWNFLPFNHESVCKYVVQNINPSIMYRIASVTVGLSFLQRNRNWLCWWWDGTHMTLSTDSIGSACASATRIAHPGGVRPTFCLQLGPGVGRDNIADVKKNWIKSSVGEHAGCLRAQGWCPRARGMQRSTPPACMVTVTSMMPWAPNPLATKTPGKPRKASSPTRGRPVGMVGSCTMFHAKSFIKRVSYKEFHAKNVGWR